MDDSYQPLPDGHIKYLQMLPASHRQDPVMLSIHTGPLNECPDYDVLSYVSDSNQYDLAILDTLLRLVRSPDTHRTFWVASACINVQNSTERGRHVALMGDIWQVAARIKAEQAALGITPPADNPLQWEGLSLVELGDPLVDDPRMLSFKALLDCPWFERVWSAQLVALSDNVQIFWGNTQLDWTEIIGVYRWMVMRTGFLWMLHGLVLADICWRPLWPMHNFVGLLTRANPFSCTDERDRIFDFLGSDKAFVAAGGDGEGIGPDRGVLVTSPNYEQSFREVYRDFAADWLDKTGNLCLLSAVDHTSETLADPIVPSWVPRWDVSQTANCYGLSDSDFNASKGLKGVRPKLVPETYRLRLNGIFCDTVAWCSSVVSLGIEDDMSCDEAVPQGGMARSVPLPGQEILAAAWKYFSSSTTPFAYEHRSRPKAFARLLCRRSYCETVPSNTPDEAAFALSVCRTTGCFGGADVEALEKESQGGHDRGAFMLGTFLTAHQRLVLTNDGFYALVPEVTQKGDKLYVLAGMNVPVVLREEEQQGCYKLMGEAFVLGMMHGEAVERASKTGSEIEEIILC